MTEWKAGFKAHIVESGKVFNGTVREVWRDGKEKLVRFRGSYHSETGERCDVEAVVNESELILGHKAKQKERKND